MIAIINTWSDLQPCHSHFKQRVDDVKRGILMAGGFPVELPALSVSESFVKPTTMMYRNMLAMETEELLRSHPVDGAVLMGGCDKTTPGLLLGATSMNIPAIFLPAGPMLRGNWQGKTLGSGSDSWKYWDELRAGKITDQDWLGVEGGIARSYGTCMTMGTASTMTAIAEAVGMVLPGGSSIPAADAGHIRLASESGRRIVDMVWEDLTPQKIQTKAAFENAIAVAMAMGCSTNAIIHLIAMARRAGQEIGLDDFERYSRRVPVIGNVRPSGNAYLMEDFFYAGGISRADGRNPRASAPGVHHRHRAHAGGEHRGAKVFNDDVIRPTEQPDLRRGLAGGADGATWRPSGCVIKPAAMDQRFLKHSGPAVVFDDYPALKQAVDDEGWDITADHVLVLRNAGPQGGPGMPEWGMLPMPKALLKQGHRDMLRMSDARMSGTSYGACILHVAPEAYIGGPLALLRTGDIVTHGRRCPHDPNGGSGRRSWRSAGPPGRRPRSGSSAATASCSPSTSSRPTKAATSTSCAPISARRLPNPSSTEGRPPRPARPRPARPAWRLEVAVRKRDNAVCEYLSNSSPAARLSFLPTRRRSVPRCLRRML